MIDVEHYEKLAEEYRERHGDEVTEEGIESAFIAGYLTSREELLDKHEEALTKEREKFETVLAKYKENPTRTIILDEKVSPTYNVAHSFDIENGSESWIGVERKE